MPPVTDNTAEIGGMPVFWRSAPTEGPAAPALYLHGVPTNSDDWITPRERRVRRSRWRRWWRPKRERDEWVEPPAYEPGFLERTGGFAPDLPGFGRSGKPGYLGYTIEEYASFIERFLDTLEVERVRMLVHDWGAVGLAFAQAHPERVERLVVTNAITFLPGYRWHRTARLWRMPVLGELAMGTTTRPILKLTSREGNVTPGPMPDAWLDTVLDHFDQGTQRAILRLYRSSPSEVLAQAGERLSLLDMPSLVVWGMADPYIPERFAAEYAKALPNSELVELADAGHWWWYDRPDAIERVADFLTAV
ncbi:MAG TPA: alpha/beta hydrolase [Solirubrobacteraceae bacterium]